MAEQITLPAVIDRSQVQTGMVVRVHQKIKDVTPSGEEKERVQVFEGMVIFVAGKGVGKTMTVRKISNMIGVEKIYPLSLPSITKIEVVKMIKARRKHIGFIRDSKKRLHDMTPPKIHTKKV